MTSLLPAPLMTAEQLALEAKAREILAHPKVRGTAAKAKALMLAGYGIDVPEEAKAWFDARMEEYIFSYVERVLCRDRNNFCLHYTCHPPYRRADGSVVPGARFYGENPDAVYRWGGLHPDRSYRLICRETGPALVDASFTLMGTYGGTTPGEAIGLHDVQREADNSFVITIDSKPAGGRSNHLTMTPLTRLLLIREFQGDWETETPLQIELLADGVVHGGAWDDEAALGDICHYAIEELYLYFWTNHLYRNTQPNFIKPPISAASLNGSAAMSTALGYFELEEDEAAILQWSTAGAKLAAISLLDWWYIPIEAHRLQSSLNNFVAEPNADGSRTVVISRQDPGIANWLDCGGLKHVLLTARWQGLPEAAVQGGPVLTSKVVKLRELESELPTGLTRCSAAEREQRAIKRSNAYLRRTGDPGSRFE